MRRADVQQLLLFITVHVDDIYTLLPQLREEAASFGCGSSPHASSVGPTSGRFAAADASHVSGYAGWGGD